jgi:PIN domain nuclease of toxin-antitoxin system
VRILLDTQIWLWSLSAPDKLGRRLRAALGRSANQIWLSPISVWELLILVERGRVKLDTEPRRWLEEAFARTPAQEATLNHEVAVRSRELSLPRQDPADRLLAATALTYDLVLATADEAILRAKPCAVLSNR